MSTRLGITVGDIHGIGIEVILKVFSDERVFEHCTPLVYGSTKSIQYYQDLLDLKKVKLNTIPDAAKPVPGHLNVINCWSEEPQMNPGQPTSQVGGLAFRALEAATADLDNGLIAGLVTAPINKEVMQSETFNFPGHTEYLRDKFRAEDILMFMVSEQLRIGLVAGHMPLKEVAGFLTSDNIRSKLEIMNYSLLKDFWIERPKIAVLGLNPHAGEGGLLGSEEQEVISPAIRAVRENELIVHGPYPSDTFFGSGDYQQFDGILGMYHDQSLIPFKTLSFGSGVNFTAGLNVVRTSPDHGTAYNLAGKNQASPSSMLTAIFTALDIIKKRQAYHEMTANPLPRSMSEKETE